MCVYTTHIQTKENNELQSSPHTHYIAQAGLELENSLAQPPACWGYTEPLPYSVLSFYSSVHAGVCKSEMQSLKPDGVKKLLSETASQKGKEQPKVAKNEEI